MSKSPIYNVKAIDVLQIVPQKENPNVINEKAYKALQMSIFNNGFTSCAIVSKNENYDPNSDTLKDYDKITAAISGGENDAQSSGGATELSDNEVRKMFKYSLVDGQQRSSIIRLGLKYYLEDKYVDETVQDPGREMIKLLAYREDFKVPCAVIDGKSDVEKMSATILQNSARGAHRFESIRDIVFKLVNEAGMSESWVSRNLFIDVDSVKRMIQVSGLKSSFDDYENMSMSWNYYDSPAYKKKEEIYLYKEAVDFLESKIGAKSYKIKRENVIEEAIKLGWDYAKSRRFVRQSEIKLNPNGTRVTGKIRNEFLADEGGE